LRQFLHAHVWTVPLLAQPFVSGPNLVVHCCRSVDGEWMGTHGYSAPIKSDGFAVVLEDATLSEELESACRKFAELSNATGSFHFDLLQSDKDGSVYFLEINLRLGGSTAKVLLLGLDEPVNMVRAFGYEPACPPKPPKHHRAAGSLRMILRHAGNVISDCAADISYPRKRSLQTFQTLLRYALMLKDPSLPHFSSVAWLGRRRAASAQQPVGGATHSPSYIPSVLPDAAVPCREERKAAQA
jgi:hypothetical protein